MVRISSSLASAVASFGLLESQARSMKYPAFKAYFFIWSISVAASLLLHAHSFWLQHEESDEIVYVALARRMSWTISDYSTRDIPGIRLLPYSIYRQPLFHRPPLYPLILKLGSRIGNPATCGLVFSCGSMVLLLWTTWRWMVFVQMPPSWAAAGFAGLVFCPLLLASTSLLHLDGLLGTYAACGLVFYIEALEHCSVFKAALAGLLLAAALNLRYNSLLIVPLIPALQAFQLYRLTRGAAASAVVEVRIGNARSGVSFRKRETGPSLLSWSSHLRSWAFLITTASCSPTAR